MSSHRTYRFGNTNPFVILVFFVVAIFALFWIAKSILKLLTYIAPFLLIGALVINHRVVIGYGKWLIGALKRNPVFGAVAILFTIIGFPLVAGFLFMRALSTRNDRSGGFGPKRGEYIKYEEVDDDFLDLTDLEERKKKMDDEFNDVVK